MHAAGWAEADIDEAVASEPADTPPPPPMPIIYGTNKQTAAISAN